MRYRILLLFFPFFFTSCGSEYAYDRTYELEGQAWAYEDTLTYTFAILDTLAIYNLYLEVEHSTDYNYQNLYTQIHTTFPSGERLTELLSLELADKSGFWLGDCGSDYCTLRVPIQQGAYFNQAGSYTITVEQYMRVNPVEGVRSIRFFLEDTGELRQ